MNIRLEKTEDYREVENLTREAFWNVYRPGCTEHYVLNQYRNNPDFIPELDFVMEENGKIIGHISLQIDYYQEYGKRNEILSKLRYAAEPGSDGHQCRRQQERGLLHLLLQGWQIPAGVFNG